MNIKIFVEKGDITEIECEAIVNPANSLLVMGGGVAGAIKRKGGKEIEEEALRHAPIPIGSAIITKGYKLKAKYVIHAPTMEQPAMRTTKEKVKKAILAALKLAEEKNIPCIAFPGMGTGVGGLSPSEGADAFRESFIEFLQSKKETKIQKIILVAFEDTLFKEFTRIKEEIEEKLKHKDK